MAEGAPAAEGLGAKVIDINMGCPGAQGDERLVRLGAACAILTMPSA